MKRTTLKRSSKKGVSDSRTLSSIKKQLLEKIGQRCVICGQYASDVDLVHIIRRSYSERLKTDKKNLILGCRKCHELFDNGNARFLMRYKGFRAVMDRMSRLDVYYYNRFMRKRIELDEQGDSNAM